MYKEAAHMGNRRTNPRHAGAEKRKRRAPQEKLRLIQLLVCLVLFLVVFLGKGIFPAKVVQLRDDLLELITANTDFRAAFSALGDPVSGDGVLGRLEDFCVEVFGAGDSSDRDEPQSIQVSPALTGLMEKEQGFLSGSPSEQTIAEHLLYRTSPNLSISIGSEHAAQEEPQANEPPDTADAVPAAGTLILKSDYSGETLPDNYTMDQLSLGELETVTPVLGYINSGYGYRDHPVNGAYLFHGGVDISGNLGDPIHAFSSGVVEYVGEDDSYGLYLQLDHGNGVKSFYAHCSTVCVRKGQSVELGDKIAEVGSSGTSTGPHLHLELKYNKLHLNPIYYIEYLTDQ